MPRYYVDTYSRHRATPDTVGIDLPNAFALESYMRRALVEIARDEADTCDAFAAFAVDDQGRLIMTVTLAMTTAFPPRCHRTS